MGKQNVNFGRLGATPSSQFWNGMMSASSAVGREQFLRWTDLVQIMMGIQSPSRWWPTLFELWTGWLPLWGVPQQWSERYEMGVPILALMVGPGAEETGPAEAPTPICVGSDLKIMVTDVTRVGGNVKVPTTNLQIRIGEDGDRISVKLVEISIIASGLEQGLYTGLVYAHAPGENYPIAVVFVHVGNLSPTS